MDREHEGKVYSVIIGKLKSSGDFADQAFRYDKEKWTVTEAEKHCKGHEGKFEPARETASSFHNRPLAILPSEASIIAEHGIGEKTGNFICNMRGTALTPHVQENGKIGTGSDIQGGQAIIKIVGILDCSVDLIKEALMELVSRDDIVRIVFDIDSPGGSIDGISNLADLIFSLRDKKEIVAVSDSMMMSAAYWIGSAASEVIMSSSTSMAGSIGIIGLHQDVSKFEEKMGIKVTEIIAGKYKNVGSPHNPLSTEAKEILQAQMDYVYGIFVEAVARNRGVSAAQVIEKMAEGRIFIGQQAIDAGLADRIESLDSVITRKEKPMANTIMAQAPAPMKAQEEDLKQEIERLKKENDDLRKENEELKKNQTAKVDETKKQCIAEERARILALDELVIPGLESIVASAKKEGRGVQETALQILKEQKARGISLQSLKAESVVVEPSAGVSHLDMNDIASAIARGAERKKGN